MRGSNQLEELPPTSFGPCTLVGFKVFTDEVATASPSGASN
jgi:hypothetical protein